MKRNELILMGVAAAVTALGGALHYAEANTLLVFVVSAASLALCAKIVGEATEQLGGRLGPGATGILQSALGNLPELFICIFALRAGLADVVKAALIGSILGNSLLVFGLALLLGGLKNGTQKFRSEPPKMMATLMILAFAALAVPTLATMFHSNAGAHIESLDIFVAIVLLVMFSASIYFFIKRDKAMVVADPDEKEHKEHATWPLSLALIVLAVSGAAAAFISDWFVEALQPAMQTLGINDVFAGLIIVAIAGNAIENLVGIQLAMRNKMDYAVSVILNSSLQIALGVFPILVLMSFVLGGAVLSFVLTPMLLAALALTVVVSAFVVFDGESIWLEGLALIGLYCLIAGAFWWG